MRIKDTDYLHISTRIKAIEARMPGREAFGKMLEAKSAEDAFTILCSALDVVRPPSVKAHMFESVLHEEEKRVSDFLSRAVSNKLLTDIFRLRFDFMNIKALMKAELLGISPDSMLIYGGTVPPEELKIAYRERDALLLDGEMQKTVGEALSDAAKTSDPQIIDIVADRNCWSYMSSLASKAGFDFINDYITAAVDSRNILSFIRQKLMGRSCDAFVKTLLPSENGLKKNFFADCYELPMFEFFEKVRKTRYHSIVVGVDDKAPKLTVLEAQADIFMNSQIKKMRRVPFGPQVVSGYYLAFEAEIKNARIVMTGKLNGEDSETIRERMRLGYE